MGYINITRYLYSAIYSTLMERAEIQIHNIKPIKQTLNYDIDGNSQQKSNSIMYIMSQFQFLRKWVPVAQNIQNVIRIRIYSSTTYTYTKNSHIDST